MKATEAKFLDFLHKSSQFVVPIYQRTYSWTEKQCQQLWDDVIRAGTDEAVSVHFVGSIVYIQDGLSQVVNQAPLLVIDGQQRLTTVTLLLEALARALGDEEPLEGFSAEKIRSYQLVNSLEKNDKYFKLLLSDTDRDTLKAIIQNREIPQSHSIKTVQNFEFFQNKLAELDGNLIPVCLGLAKLMLVDIALNRDTDNPQLIFESMNSTGRELSQADLIRNFILMGLDHELQTELYEVYWRPMERQFGQEAYDRQFDGFIRNYLTFKTGSQPRLGDVYESFKAYAIQQGLDPASVRSLVHEVKIFADYYCRIALGQEKDANLHAAFQDIAQELNTTVSFPLILSMYGDFEQGVLSQADFLTSVRLIESYVFRRAVCGLETKSMNKTFAEFNKHIDKEHYLESIMAHFMLLKSYRRFPLDDEFNMRIKLKDMYYFSSKTYWLKRLENFGRKERVSVAEYTIEHIMPQNPNLSPEWMKSLGDHWQEIQKKYLHTIGNLTLTGYNSEYSDKPFTEKRDMKGGFKESPLVLNAGIGALETWDEKTINDRADILANLACKVWIQPSLTIDQLSPYIKVKSDVAKYTLDDHEKLNAPHIRELFDALRTSIMAIDPCVTETFNKLYVAYKAETNFVDIVPQKSRLKLSLNMPFDALSDPQEKAKNVTDLGRWGNGDVEVGFSDLAQLPYVMSLINQSFERQMNSTDD